MKSIRVFYCKYLCCEVCLHLTPTLQIPHALRSLRHIGLAFVLAGVGAFANAAWADPPAQVARLDLFEGAATMLPAGSSTWVYANINRPLSDGDQVWIDADSRAEMVAGSTAMRLGANTSLSILELSDAATQLKLTQGVFEVRVREPMQGRSFEIDTPNLAFDLQTPGDYRVNVNPDNHTTTVIVRAGQGVAYGAGGASYAIDARQMVQISGTALVPDYATLNPPPDSFDHWVAMLERREDASVSARYVGFGMTGYQSLDQYGRWEDNPIYGQVWVPTVTTVGWAPYHYGHWTWIAPWGWTWIDDEPWGFAPFHYGRWAYVADAWAWVPGPVLVRPVYAPALVAFIGGGGGGVRWGVSLSIGTPGIAWFPLAPGEAYRPAYAASPTYINTINRTVNVYKTVNVVNNTTVINNIQRTVYINQQAPGAVTAMPAAAFVRGQQVQSTAVPFHPQHLAAAHVMFTPPIAPVRQSLEGRKPASPPPSGAFERTVFATRAPSAAPAMHDTLAQKFNAENGTVPGAGRALVLREPTEHAPGFVPAQGVHLVNDHGAGQMPQRMQTHEQIPQRHFSPDTRQHSGGNQPLNSSETTPRVQPHNAGESTRAPIETGQQRRVLDAVSHPPAGQMSGRGEQQRPQEIQTRHPAVAHGEQQSNAGVVPPKQHFRPEFHPPVTRGSPVDRGPEQHAQPPRPPAGQPQHPKDKKHTDARKSETDKSESVDQHQQ